MTRRAAQVLTKSRLALAIVDKFGVIQLETIVPEDSDPWLKLTREMEYPFEPATTVDAAKADGYRCERVMITAVARRSSG